MPQRILTWEPFTFGAWQNLFFYFQLVLVILGAIAIRPGVCISHRLWEAAPSVQQTLDAVVERLLLLNRVVEHLGKAGEGAQGRVFKNARFWETYWNPYITNDFTMTTLPRTYGYARVSKADDYSKNLDTQLRILADHGIRDQLVYSDVASGRTLKRPGWQDLMARLQPGDILVVAFLDRLSRNFEDGVRIQADLTERNIGIVARQENIDTREGSAAAKFFRRSMLAQGAYQADSTSERSKLGLAPTTASTPAVARAPAVEPASTPAVTPLTSPLSREHRGFTVAK